MPAILIYVLGVLTLPFLCLAYCLLVDLFHRSAWYCPWCSEWAVKSKDNPNRTTYLPNIIVWFARIGHRLSKRHRKWKRVYETYDFHPCKPSNVLRDGHMDEVIPLDDFDYGYQTIRYKSHRKGLDGKELITTVDAPSETPYITCIRDGEQTEGDVYRNPGGSLSLIPWENNPSGKRFPLFDKDGNPAPLISPKEEELGEWVERKTVRQQRRNEDDK